MINDETERAPRPKWVMLQKKFWWYLFHPSVAKYPWLIKNRKIWELVKFNLHHNKTGFDLYFGRTWLTVSWRNLQDYCLGWPIARNRRTEIQLMCVLSIPKPVGYWCIGEGSSFIQFAIYKKPNWFHRQMTRLMFGWKWKWENTNDVDE